MKPDRARLGFNKVFESRTPYNLLEAMVVPNLGKATRAAARAQSLIRQAAIACALERYRLANDAYPESLAGLVPRFLDRVPSDVFAGESFRYRRLGEESFLLYSVGWNGKDDGGVEARNAEGRPEIETGDWVWNLKGR